MEIIWYSSWLCIKDLYTVNQYSLFTNFLFIDFPRKMYSIKKFHFLYSLKIPFPTFDVSSTYKNIRIFFTKSLQHFHLNIAYRPERKPRN